MTNEEIPTGQDRVSKHIGVGMKPIADGPAEPLAWPPPYEELDGGIREIVWALVQDGFTPLSSCDGHGEGDPQVAIRRDDDQTRSRLVVWLKQNGLEGCFVGDIYMVQPSGLYDSHVKINWFGGGLARKRLLEWTWISRDSVEEPE